MMDTEESVVPVKDPDRVLSEEELASQVAEIISGITRGALQSLEEAVEVAAVSLEDEGDDSVFYDEENKAPEDTEEATSWPSGAIEREDTSLVTTTEVAGGASIPQENNTGADLSTDEDHSQAQREVSEIHQDTQTDLYKEYQEPESAQTEPMKEPTEDPSDVVADSGLEQTLAHEEPLNTCGESPLMNNTPAGSQTQPEQSTLPEEGVEEDMSSPQQQTEVQTPEAASPNVSEEDKDVDLNGKAEAPEQTSSDELQVSGESQDELDQQEPHRDHKSSQSSMSPPQDSNPGYSTLPLVKKSGRSIDRKKSFDHHTSSKYNTVSYRKIRRGNTRQKIAAFESMIINL